MGKIEIATEIEAPLEKVFAFYADPRNNEKTVPEGAELKVEKTSKGPIGLGMTFHFSTVLGGRKVKFENESVEFEENSRIVCRQIKGDLKRFNITQVFEATDKGAKVTSTLDYELPYSVLGKIMDKLKVRKELEHYYKASDEKAKEILEE